MKVVHAFAFGLLGFLVGLAVAYFTNESANLGTRGPGAFAVLVGIILVLIPYFTLVEKLNSDTLASGNTAMGMFALRASNYLFAGGFVVLLLGLVSLLKLFPWL